MLREREKGKIGSTKIGSKEDRTREGEAGQWTIKKEGCEGGRTSVTEGVMKGGRR